MQAFVWNDRFLTGVDSIDSQHQHLFEIANRVGTLLIESSAADAESAAAVDAVFTELANYARTHFRDEEQFMHASGIDKEHFAHHVRSHRDFVEQVKTMWSQRASMSAPAEILHGFLVAWLTYHILGEDQAMAREVMRLKKGLTAEAAHQLEPNRGERSTGALLEALGNLYKVLSSMNRDLSESNRRLEERVAERTRELLQAEKMASIGQLAAGVAHEINNPIGFVNSNVNMLGRYVQSLLQLAEIGAQTPAGQALKGQVDLDYLREDLPELIKESQDGLERVRRIVANLKDFSRIDSTEWESADLLAGLESTVSVAWHELKYKAEIKRELMPLPSVRCVLAQINQVFLNLLINAAQAIAEHGTITLRSGCDEQQVWVEIEDTGYGMDEATQRRIFEPFFTTKPVGTGTGLGMSLTYDIIKKHAGRIDIDSAPGRGTRIRIWLPISGTAGSAADSSAHSLEP